MKIAILTSGILPVPAVCGGAVENLTDFYLEYNDRHHLHDITVYSTENGAARKHRSTSSAVNHYVFVDTESLLSKIIKRIYRLVNREEYYHYTIEFYLAKALRDIRKHHFDAIIIENRPGYAIHTRMFPRHSKIIYHLHNDVLNINTARHKELYVAADRIITVSDYISKRVKTISPDDTKCITVHNGIDIGMFATNGRKHVGRAALGISESDFVIVFSGRMIPEKGISELIEAMTILKNEPNTKLLVIGGAFFANDTGTNSFIDSLVEKAEPIKDRIIFTGFVPYADIPDYLNLADIAALPSTWEEPFGLTCVEALAAGLPVITTRRGGIPEIATDECAVIITPDDNLPRQLANAISAMTASPDRRKEMSMASKKRAAMFSKERYAEHFFKALQ